VQDAMVQLERFWGIVKFKCTGLARGFGEKPQSGAPWLWSELLERSGILVGLGIVCAEIVGPSQSGLRSLPIFTSYQLESP
jgi:hypothetical protein